MSDLGHPFNVYVSREDADNMIYKISVPMWLALLLFFIVLLNVFVWGVIGLVEAVEYIL